MPWTEKQVAELRSLWQQRLSSFEIAERMGVSRSAVKNRAAREGLRFLRQDSRMKQEDIGHIPATPRCGEILRAHGWRI